MILVPMVRRSGKVDLLIVLDEQSIDRIKQYDQAEVIWDQMPSEYSTRRAGTIGISFATAREQAEIAQMSVTDPDWKQKTFNMLTRGFKFEPDKGDHDFGPTVLGQAPPGPKQ